MSLCCKCGASMRSNPSNMCEACIASDCDITADIQKQHTITFCPKCSRFLNPPSQWVPAALESPELLSLCLKKVKGLGKGTKLKEASFLFTEAHSRRLAIQIVLRGELQGNIIVEQKAVLDFAMHPQQCTDCTRHAAKDYWNACVQVRQRVDHKRTLHYLEQVLLRKNLQKQYSNVKQAKGGIDFFFSNRGKAMAFVEFVSKIIPCRMQTSQQLKSHDVHNNTYNYKFTFCLEVVPVCKHDVVCLSKGFANRLGFANQLLLVTKITDKIRLIDPASCQVRDLDVQTYFAHPFLSISTPRNSTRFFVMDLEEMKAGSGLNEQRGDLSVRDVDDRLKPVGVWVVPESNLVSGTDDGDSVFARSHLGHILKVGDIALGLDLRSANINNAEFDSIPDSKRPDVILIQRLHAPVSPKPTKRKRKSESRSTFNVDLQESADSNEESLLDADDVEFMDAQSEEEGSGHCMQIND